MGDCGDAGRTDRIITDSQIREALHREALIRDAEQSTRKAVAKQETVMEEADMQDKMVHHPRHYTSHPKSIECIDVIEENPFVNLAQAMKYIWRVSWGSKGNDIQDLQKSVWYINREIARRKAAQ